MGSEMCIRDSNRPALVSPFKADTDDMRDAVSIPLAHALIDAGITLKAYDPVANERAKPMLPAQVQYQSSDDLAAEGADAIATVSDWPEFSEIDFRSLKVKMRTHVVMNLRNFLNEEEVRSSGFRYFGIGRQRRQAFEKADRKATVLVATRMGEDLLPGRVATTE